MVKSTILNDDRLEERLAQRKAKLAEMKKTQEQELSKNDPEEQENLAKEQVGQVHYQLPHGRFKVLYLAR